MPDEPQEPNTPTNFRGIDPGELLARGMQSVKMSSGGGHGWTPPSLDEAARFFQNYEVLGLLGYGGMGAVYQARQTSLDRLVAIKLLPLEVSVDQSFADRFRREARAMAKLNHPHIVAVHDFGQTGEGHLFFVMEFVDGATLHQLIRGAGISPPDTLQILAQVCDALAYAHGEGVVHRDIKPANVLVDARGRAKVADFGLARLTAPGVETWGTTMTGTILGTPDYMAPEQKRGMNVDHRADIYALGVMLYEMLVGEVPQGAFEPPSLRAGVDKRLDQVVARALAPQPEKRYQSTGEFKIAVEAIRPAVLKAELKKPAKPKPKPVAPAQPTVGDTTVVSPLAKRQRPTKAGARLKLWLPLAAAVLVLGGIGWWISKKSARHAPATLTTSEFKLLDPADLREGSGIEKTVEALVLSGQKVLFDTGPLRDGFVRTGVKIADATSEVHLYARVGEGGYRVVFSRDALAVQRSDPRGTFNTLRSITPARQSDNVFDIELRAVGSVLTVRVNGQIVAELEDGAFQEGLFGVGASASARLSIVKMEGVRFDPAKAVTVAPATPTSPAAAYLPAPEPGFRRLFDGQTLAGWRAYAPSSAPVWSVEGEALTADVRSLLITKEEFTDFDLRLEWRVGPQGNGGAFFHVLPGEGGSPSSAPEFQLNARDNADPIKTGALYGIQLATEDTSFPTGSWNTARLLVQSGRCEHWVNDKLVCTYDQALLRASKYTGDARSGRVARGSIGLQSWHGEVAYRNIRIRPLDSVAATVPAAPSASLLPVPGKPLTFAGHRYQFVPGTLPWLEAKAKAVGMGGHLATITSPAENAWVRDTYAAQLPRDETGFWLGGFLATDSGAWEWLTGEEPTFFSWGRGKPQRRVAGPGSEPPYYILMYRSPNHGGEPRWHDLSVSQRGWESQVVGFLVEWDRL